MHPDGQIDRNARQRGIDRYQSLREPGLAPLDGQRAAAAVRLLGRRAGRGCAVGRTLVDVFRAEIAAIRLEIGDDHLAIGPSEHDFPRGGDRAVGLIKRSDLQGKRREPAGRRRGEAGEREWN